VARPTLWQINDELDVIFAAIEEAGGEITPDLEARLDAAQLDFDTKIEHCALKRRDLILDAEKIQAEEARLRAKREAVERQAERLAKYIALQLARRQVRSGGGLMMKVKVYKNTQPSVRWLADPDLIPQEWRKAPPPPPKPELDYRTICGLYKAQQLPADDPRLEVVVGEHLRFE
jgi:hypothetical protein